MEIFHGISAGSGRVYGKISVYRRECEKLITKTITDIESEQSRFKLARYIAVKELSVLYERAYAELDEAAAMIFYIHQLMLDDDTFTESVCSIISQKRVNAEAAVSETADILAAVFTGMSDGYMRARRADVRDICERVIAILQSASQPYPQLTSPSIVAAEELSPSEILLAEKGMIIGLILTNGAPDSHASILAKKMHIPALCCVDCGGNTLINGKNALIDADNGALYLEPDSETVSKLIKHE